MRGNKKGEYVKNRKGKSKDRQGKVLEVTSGGERQSFQQKVLTDHPQLHTKVASPIKL